MTYPLLNLCANAKHSKQTVKRINPGVHTSMRILFQNQYIILIDNNLQ